MSFLVTTYRGTIINTVTLIIIMLISKDYWLSNSLLHPFRIDLDRLGVCTGRWGVQNSQVQNVLRFGKWNGFARSEGERQMYLNEVEVFNCCQEQKCHDVHEILNSIYAQANSIKEARTKIYFYHLGNIVVALLIILWYFI